MNEAREEVAHYTRGLAFPSNRAEEALVRVEQQPIRANDPGEEALLYKDRALLEIERVALAEAWGELKRELREQGKDDSAMRSVPETFDSVIRTAQEAQIKMNNRRRLGGGKPKEYYNKFCKKAYQHRTIFEVFPNTNEYTSVFCGAMGILIKASANYFRISEGLAQAFDEIAEHVDFAKRQVEMMPTQHTRSALAKLYKEIFLYLRDCISWFNKTSRVRALRSFNENFYDRFADRMKCIKDIACTLHQEVTIGGIQSLQVMLARTEDIEQQRRRHWDNEMARWRVERQQMMTGNIQQQILQSFEQRVLEMLDRESGLRAAGMLEGVWHTDRWQRVRDRRVETLEGESSAWRDEGEESLPTTASLSRDLEPRGTVKQRYERSSIWASSKGLDSFILGNSVDLLNTLRPGSFAAASVALNIRDWLGSPVSTTLWIQGAPVRHYPTEYSELAGSLITAASASKTPILFHFCEPVESDIAEGLSLEEAGAVSLAYSLIRQLIALLEPDICVDIDFSDSRFLPLETPCDSWNEALSLLDDLFGLAPGVLLCVVDGIDYLDYGRGEAKCADFFALVRKRELSSKESGSVLKTLFTTTGHSRALDDGLRVDEVVIDRGSKQPSHGKPGPGQQSIFD
ncbi:hypothetical protein GP486_002013 [Trichoglossum hirsutum]|uniref:DUF7708 domain-containing protein n=1 Tax=Trichoglossum hirsutum TaxID=265104 RepID=A0A9P8RSH4_9PEZI|nr:hypothetical protein GP486_002013 [Trichoglossum hirsutum]